MKEQLITFETAKLAKEKGFDDVVTNHLPYMLEGDDEGCIGASIYCKVYANCCTQSLLQKWLREEKDVLVEVNFNDSLYRKLHEAARKKVSSNYHYGIYTSIKDPEHVFEKFWSDDTFETYEEALEEGLQRALKMVR